ncbi:ATP-binding protein [Armatimonas rosea]|uniref:Putative ATPase/DNA-binding SARP family transcriptional activator n=1 Tax=Armatimonas rosea TaxID=685828 RepID=A0A7W9ST60_ARMRO|nr:tetratricopeptide repeat protein [Armatimonas rosea]MBB6051744.1 putative ATPase/DNA-binding SARP family transcriptional activator [Armatimonas rosea]
MALTLRLFKGFQLLSEGAPLPPGERRQAGEYLLALLVLRGSQARLSLAATLWPEATEERALFYLRRTLVELRKRLGDHASTLTEPEDVLHTLKLELPPGACDLWEFERAIQRGDDLAAVNLYQGPLLDGWSEDWVLQARSLKQQQFISALERLAMQAKTPEEAIAQLQRLVELDPGRESAWRPLMTALADRGDPAGVVEAYRKLRLWLQREYRLEPSPETLAHYQQIRSATRQKKDAVVPAPAHTPVRQSRLPLPPTPLIGREQALQEIAKRLNETRLLTLVGMGGVGKTRLAVAVLESLQAAGTYPEGVAWIDLAALSDPKLIAPRIAATLDIPETVDLVEALRTRSVLLALDNCEHLLNHMAALCETLLAQCPYLHLLATSREPLGLAQESLWRVPVLTEEEALQLFTVRAQKVLQSWELTPENRPLVRQLCQKLDDLPFAIELAAARIDTLSLEELGQRLDARFDLLTGGSRSTLRPQLTLRAAMDWSWNLLTPDERDALRQLATFVSPFSFAASEAACPRSLPLLSSLVAKSLVIFSPETGRYRLLETVREYAIEQGLGEPGRAARQGYLRYVLAETRKAATFRSGVKRRQAHDSLEEAHDNIRLTLADTQESSPELALELAGNLWPFWTERGYRTEGLRTLRQLLQSAERFAPTTRLQAHLGMGVLAYETGDFSLAQAELQTALSLAEQCASPLAQGDALRVLGLVHWNQGSPEAAKQHYQRALEIFCQAGDQAGEAAVQASLGHLAWNLGHLDQAMYHNQESRYLFQQLEDEAGVAETSANLGLIARSQEDYPRARQYMEEALDTRTRLNLRGGIGAMIHHLGVLSFLEHSYEDAAEQLARSAQHWREMGDPGWAALSLYYLGLVQRELNRLPAAVRSFSEALLIRRRQGAKRPIAALQHGLGLIWLQQGRLNEAQLALKESAQVRMEIGLEAFSGESVDALACLVARRGELRLAVQLLACASRLREKHGEVEPEHPHRDEATARSRAGLTPEQWQEAWDRGSVVPPAMQLAAL